MIVLILLLGLYATFGEAADPSSQTIGAFNRFMIAIGYLNVNTGTFFPGGKCQSGGVYTCNNNQDNIVAINVSSVMSSNWGLPRAVNESIFTVFDSQSSLRQVTSLDLRGAPILPSIPPITVTGTAITTCHLASPSIQPFKFCFQNPAKTVKNICTTMLYADFGVPFPEGTTPVFPDCCSNGIQDASETGIDCGGSVCTAPCSCTNGIQDGTEVGVDCGGSCAKDCCSNGVKDDFEAGVDCGSSFVFGGGGKGCSAPCKIGCLGNMPNLCETTNATQCVINQCTTAYGPHCVSPSCQSACGGIYMGWKNDVCQLAQDPISICGLNVNRCLQASAVTPEICAAVQVPSQTFYVARCEASCQRANTCAAGTKIGTNPAQAVCFIDMESPTCSGANRCNLFGRCVPVESNRVCYAQLTRQMAIEARFVRSNIITLLNTHYKTMAIVVNATANPLYFMITITNAVEMIGYKRAAAVPVIDYLIAAGSSPGLYTIVRDLPTTTINGTPAGSTTTTVVGATTTTLDSTVTSATTGGGGNGGSTTTPSPTGTQPSPSVTAAPADTTTTLVGNGPTPSQQPSPTTTMIMTTIVTTSSPPGGTTLKTVANTGSTKAAPLTDKNGDTLSTTPTTATVVSDGDPTKASATTMAAMASGSMIPIIAGAVGGGLLLLIIIIVIVVCVAKKGKKKEEEREFSMKTSEFFDNDAVSGYLGGDDQKKDPLPGPNQIYGSVAALTNESQNSMPASQYGSAPPLEDDMQ